VASRGHHQHARFQLGAQGGARFSDLVDRALTQGPQLVTRRGKHAVVVVSVEEWECRNRRRGDLVDFFASSPLREDGLQIERAVDHPRELDL